MTYKDTGTIRAYNFLHVRTGENDTLEITPNVQDDGRTTAFPSIYPLGPSPVPHFRNLVEGLLCPLAIDERLLRYVEELSQAEALYHCSA